MGAVSPAWGQRATFAKVDHQLFTLLWQWARRRHSHKSRHWVREKYFRFEDGNNWVFFGHVMRSNGTQEDMRLFRAPSVRIRRHTKIKGAANPYDPAWEPYFEARQGVRMARHLKGRRSLLRLWLEGTRWSLSSLPSTQHARERLA